MPIIEVEGHDFYFFEKNGKSPTIMMLCSTGLDSRQWKDLFPMIDGRKVISPHYLNYSKSSSWKNGGPIDSWVDYRAAESLLLARSGEIDLIGHSYGGFIALRLAKEHPDRIRRIALHEPIVWGCLQHTDRDDLKNEFGEVVETFFKEGLEPEDFLRDFVDYWNKVGSWDSMSEERKKSWRDLQPKILSEVRLLCYDKTPPSYYEDINHPTLITVSKATPPHQYEACKILSTSLPNVKVFDVNGGHMGVVTKSGEVMPHLAGWITD